MSAVIRKVAPLSFEESSNCKPDLVEVVQVRQQASDVKSVRVRFVRQSLMEQFQFQVGQYGMFSLFGMGECPFHICSSSTWKGFLEFCFRKTGSVTEGMWHLEPGDVMGFRGPYGNGYPMLSWEGKGLIFVGDGIGMPAIRCAIWYALENRRRYGQITIVYGARTETDLVYRDELTAWSEVKGVAVHRCVEPGGAGPRWDGELGFVPDVLQRIDLNAAGAVALVVGPPVMIQHTMPVLAAKGLSDGSIYTSAELPPCSSA